MKKVTSIAIAVIISFTAFAQKEHTTKPTADTSVQKKYSCPMHPEITGDKPGKCPKCGMDLTLTKKEVAKVYTCPMHPEVTSGKPGKCTKCGMDLTAIKPKPVGKKH